MAAAAMRRTLILAAALLALAACGSRDPLRPRSAEATPVKPATAAVAPTTQELLTPPPIARPVRQDEGLLRSEERKDDPFDLPPTR
jgi:predicted small lipoprotein YifL